MPQERKQAGSAEPSEKPFVTETPAAGFPIVGIGASAGGLEAFRELLENLPPDTGMAFVYVQHMEPRHQSMLAKIFARHSRMPVDEIQDGMRVEPNHVYVIPPNANLTVSEALLRLSPRTEIAGHHMPADYFLRSLAEDQKSCAIAVVLSGTSSDGALGLLEVKQAGGITFAQDDSARHDGMPRAAISTGGVDFVLSPGGIARELVRIGQHPAVGGNGKADPHFPSEAEHLFDNINTLLRMGKGVDFSSYRQSTIRRRIGRRMALNRIERLEDYVALLQKDGTELDALYNDVLIKVTAFFRDRETFSYLEKSILPEMIRKRPAEQSLRVWVPGCASGEEAYSLGMCILETMGEMSVNIPIQIFGTDASEVAIQKARSGVYVENIQMDVSLERLKRFFVQINGHYQINKTVRDLCVFARHDLTRDPPFSNVDLISCRNLLIYLAPHLQERIIPFFHFALRPGGMLLLGSSENPAAVPELFSVVDRRHRLFTPNPAPRRVPFDYMPQAADRSRRARDKDAPTYPTSEDVQLEADRLEVERFAHAGVVINEYGEIIQFRGNTRLFLDQPAGRATFDLLKIAREGLRPALQSAIQDVRRTGERARREGISLQAGGEALRVNIDVLRLKLPRDQYLLVMFEVAHGAETETAPADKIPVEEGENLEIQRLRQELEATTEYLQSIIEELRTANEEALSNNEELQSVNEEVETGKEELQSANEELATVNEELQTRNADLARANSDLNNLLSSSNMPTVLLDGALRIRLFAPVMDNVLNLIPADVGRQISDIRSALEADDLASLIRIAVENARTEEREVRDKKGRWYLLRVRPYITVEHKVDGAVLTLLDIDSRKRAELEREDLMGRIESERAKLELVIQQMPAGVIIVDAAGNVTMANRQVENIIRHPFQATGRVDEQIQYRGFHPEGQPYTPDQWPITRSLRGGEVVRDEEIDYVRGDGTRFTMRASSAPIRDREGRIVAGVLVFDEITERKVLQEQLAQSLKMEAIGRLAGGVAHDFNNLLTVIAGYTNMVHDDLPPDSHMRDPLEEVIRAANRAASLTSQLLAFSRRQPIRPRILDLNPVVAGMEKLLRRMIGEHITVETRFGSNLGRVHADPGQIEQILTNLVLNARDAILESGGKDGRITIQTSEVTLHQDGDGAERAHIMLSVRDTGIGMDVETRRHLFEPFFTTKGIGKGTGLGLSSVYGIVSQNGWHIAVDSEPGEGTTFRVCLPRVEGEAAITAAAEKTGEDLRGTETILVVEDEPGVRQMTRSTLERFGYNVLEAGDGVEAMRIYHDHAGVISMVVTDVIMPQTNGPDLAKRLHALQPGLKVVFMSGYPESTINAHGVLDISAGFIQKPFMPEDLARKVRNALDE